MSTAGLLHIPNDDPIRVRSIPAAPTCDLLARRRRLHLTAPFLAREVDGRPQMRARALEMYAIDVALIQRGALDQADSLLAGATLPAFTPVDQWKADRRARGLKDHP